MNIMVPIVNTDIKMSKPMMNALALFETQCVVLGITEVTSDDVIVFLKEKYGKDFSDNFRLEYLYPFRHPNEISTNQPEKSPEENAVAKPSYEASLERADKLIERLKDKGYLLEQLPKLDDSDGLYMALHNKKRTGKFSLD
jgi:hypothetical protein